MQNFQEKNWKIFKKKIEKFLRKKLNNFQEKNWKLCKKKLKHFTEKKSKKKFNQDSKKINDYKWKLKIKLINFPKFCKIKIIEKSQKKNIKIRKKNFKN